MDPHSLLILEYAKVKAMLAGYAASSLGKAEAARLEPLADPAPIRVACFDIAGTGKAEHASLRYAFDQALILARNSSDMHQDGRGQRVSLYGGDPEPGPATPSPTLSPTS